jgi:hypothetical protein
MRKNIVSANCKHDCENSTEQKNVSRHRFLKPCLRRQIMEHYRITLERIA